MDAAELRARQRPVKDRYREAPESARVPARAVAVVDQGAVACRVESEAETVVAGLHAAAGGDGDAACSADLLLGSLAACAGVTLAAVATAMAVDLRQARVVAEGHWDARGTLGVDKDAPVGMTDITLTVEVETDAPDETVSRLVALTERYCVIAQTLAHPPEVAFTSRRA
ncbi:MAG: OsmC family peroxiredoxin [Actinomycetales bacterium]|nr:OsmC family peroxiredoxin [Actinomycetales bacterium]